MKRWMRNPLFWILMAAAGLRLSGLFWGLPASDGWDDDGFSPRNFLTALALTWKPGSYFTYPPLHALLLAILNLPSIILALLHTPSLRQPDVISRIRGFGAEPTGGDRAAFTRAYAADWEKWSQVVRDNDIRPG